MRPPKDLVPRKVVAADLCVSQTTLWRAMKTVAGFPQPVIVRGLVYWRKGDLKAIEDALDRYEGRRAYERKRDYTRKVSALTKLATPSAKRSRRTRGRQSEASEQKDLF